MAARALAPFLQRAAEMEKHDPRVAYYCRMSALEQGLSIPAAERDAEANALLGSLMKRLEARSLPSSPLCSLTPP
jgi:vacuolar protein sorting-associated protein VTA1